MKDSSSQPNKKKKKQQPKRVPSKVSGKKSKATKQSNEKKEKASLSRRDEFSTRVALTAQSFRKHTTTATKATTKNKDTRVAAAAVAVAATKTKSRTIPLANDDSPFSTHKNHPKQQRQQRQQQKSCTTSNKKKLVKLWQQHPNIIILTFLAMGLLLLSLSVIAVMGHVRNKQAAQKQASGKHGSNNNRPVPQYGNDDYYFTDRQDEKHDVDIFGQPQESNAFVCGPQIWPHLLGVQVNEARDIILQQNPCVYVLIVMMDDDNQQPNDERYDPERVRLYMDKDTGTVAHVPRVG